MSGSRLACAFLLVVPSLALAGNFEQGVDALDRQAYVQAVAFFTACIRENPRDAAAFTDRGIAHAGNREIDQAIADYTQAIRLNPRVAAVYTNRGLAYADKQQFGKAIDDYTHAIKLDSGKSAPFYYRANAYADKKDYDSAIADYTTVLRLEPKDVLALNNRGIAHGNKKAYVKAYKDFAAAVQLDPKYAQALNNLAWLMATCPHEDLRDGKKAVDHATRACELSAWKVAGCLTTLAAAHAECGHFPEAVQWENKAIQLGFPNRPETGRAYERLHLYEKGEPYHEN